MIRIYNYADIKDADIFERGMAARDVGAVVRDIISDVRARGDAALIEYAQKFDGAALDELEVPKADIDKAYSQAPTEFICVLERACENISEFHTLQLREGFRLERPDGAILGQRITPIENVGLYIPGGTASYPSTLLMNAIPARIAGCRQTVMCSPPSQDGTVNQNILAAAKLAGVQRVFRAGGAQAIAALAYGTQTIPRVDKIVGPGNAYVAEAKRQVFGAVGIEMIAGPSEILIIADASARADYVAADMLSQAEHDVLSSAVLITDNQALAQRVCVELEQKINDLPRANIARKSIDENGRIIIVNDIAQAIEASNRLAPEHLELYVENPFKCLDMIKNAGSVFLGENCPEALGDYMAGINHTLPTSGAARFSNPLSVDDFVKKTQYIYYTRRALDASKADVAAFARAEGLEAHALSALSRGEALQ